MSLLFPLLRSYFLSLLEYPILSTSSHLFLCHSSSFLLPTRVSMRTRGPAIPFLRFSHFNATSVRLRDDTYYTLRSHDNTVDNGNDGCTSHFMPPLPSTNPRVASCRSTAAPAKLSCRLFRFPSFVLSSCQKNVGSNAH